MTTPSRQLACHPTSAGGKGQLRRDCAYCRVCAVEGLQVLSSPCASGAAGCKDCARRIFAPGRRLLERFRGLKQTNGAESVNGLLFQSRPPSSEREYMPHAVRLPILFIAVLVVGLSCRGRTDPSFIQLAEARQTAAEMRVGFHKASDASDRAVMADTDAASQRYAREAEVAADGVQVGGAQLAGRLLSLGRRADAELLATFQERFTRYRLLERQILKLAVENTNLKAQRLSFGPVRRAADAFCDALDAAVVAGPAARRCRDGETAARAELAVREIQILQAPHIAESEDAEMDRMEKEMAARQAAARTALGSLSDHALPAAGAPLERARAALDRFDGISRELIALSRANSNVRSLELALRQKPALTTACDENLAGLESALAKAGFSGTR